MSRSSTKSERRVVIDTGVVVSALFFPGSVPSKAFNLALDNCLILESPETLAELREVVSRPKFDRYASLARRREFLSTFVQGVTLTETTTHIAVCRDPADDKFLELAIDGGATWLVTGDSDLLVLKRYRSVEIVTPESFLSALHGFPPQFSETTSCTPMSDEPRSLNFLEEIIEADLAAGKNDRRVHTRFPPEPNGYLHIGHAKSICLNFGLARKYGGKCNLRFDDTNPTKEDTEYVDSIMEDVRWLGFEWDGLYYASDYFQQLYDWAIQLIKMGKAYVCDLNGDQVREHRGTLTAPGKNSPYRDRTVAENLDLFERMKNGEFPDGSRTLRAKIDMASPNLNMRDPVLFRILHAEHHRTGNQWCIYAMYDWAHGQSDSIEGITHSICTLEFENHRPLYDWFIETLGIYAPHQYEFARLNLTYTVMSKRLLLNLVQEKHVSGWDDPRMPTISGLRRRGYTPESIRLFCDRIGVARFFSTIDMNVLEGAVRDDLNKRAERRMAVLRPIKLVIENWPEGRFEEMEATNNPEDPAAGTRKILFGRELYIEQDDFREEPPKKFHRLYPGNEVRLRAAYIIKCTGVVKDEKSGEITEIRCTYDPETRSGMPQADRKVKGTIHWVSAAHAVTAEVRLYDHLFAKEDPSEFPAGQTYLANLNPNSLEVLRDAKLEPSLARVQPGDRYQFERNGYFCVDKDSTTQKLVFNRTVTLKDTWAKIEKKG